MAFRKNKCPVELTDKVVNGIKAFTPDYNPKHYKFLRLYDGTPALMTIHAYNKRKKKQEQVKAANREKKKLKAEAELTNNIKNMFK